MAADGRDWKYSGSGSPSSSTQACPMSSEPTVSPVDRDQRPVGLVGEQSWATPVNANVYTSPTNRVIQDHHGDRRKDLTTHHTTPSPPMTRSMSLMPMNGATMPPAP